MKKVVLLSTFLMLASPAYAQQSTAPGITVTNAWARATSASQKIGGVFLTLTDNGGPDRLVSVTSPIADSLELHETVSDGGVMRMRPVPRLALEPGHPVELKPGGYHLMVMGLKQKLTAGATFPVTLTFEKAPSVTATVTVGSAGAAGPARMDMQHGDMHMPKATP